jgi:hypothetical protein
MGFANADVYLPRVRYFIMFCEEFGLVLVYKLTPNANDLSR